MTRRHVAAFASLGLFAAVPALIALGFYGTTWCRGNAWWSTDLGESSSVPFGDYLQPYVIGAVLALVGACYLLALAAGARPRVAKVIAIGAAVVGGPAIWFLAIFEALIECPP